ncbi:MAG TPA: hypothetical protein VHA80_14690 [Solirubrobacterales bacterium]|jgi:hypothetical protein|nr:hypothetical protein [Solirubrobacterales bacterium]
MRIDLSDLNRLTTFAGALDRLFWCLMALGFLTAIFGSAGTGLFVLILGAAAFVARAGLEDFVRSREEAQPAAPEPKLDSTHTPEPAPAPEFTVYRAPRRLRRPKSAI